MVDRSAALSSRFPGAALNMSRAISNSPMDYNGEDQEKDGWGELWRMHLDCKRMRGHQKPQAGKAFQGAAATFQEKVGATTTTTLNGPSITTALVQQPQAKNWLQMLETYMTKICTN